MDRESAAYFRWVDSRAVLSVRVKNLCTVIIVDGVGLTDLENLSAHTQLQCVERPKNYGLWR
jgi:hypothetical protein